MWKVKNPLALEKFLKIHQKKPKTTKIKSIRRIGEQVFYKIKKLKSNLPPQKQNKWIGGERRTCRILGFRVNMGIELVNSKP